MSLDHLKAYIDQFRVWLAEHGEAGLESRGDLVTQWKEELAAAERLLDEKPELPIAFLGPSQQGKSSLINALLGENILAVGGAVGACTCVVTSLHYHAHKNYRAEIEFIAIKDWKRELESIRTSTSSKPTDDDLDIDRRELEADQLAALEKLKAVYRLSGTADVDAYLNSPTLGLPDEIVAAMTSGEPMILAESSPQTLRNRVRRYLVGREQHEDGQYWPVISQVRIYGNFEVLSNGVVLVDLPGLNDPNPAREQVTKRYLDEARYIWLVCNAQVGIDRVFDTLLRDQALLLRLFLEGRLPTFAVIATQVDNVNLEAVLGQMGLGVDDYDGNHASLLEFRRKEITAHVQRHLLAIAADISTKAEAADHRDAFLERIRKVPAFSISTSAYLHAIGRMPLFQGLKLSADESHIPLLLQHLHSVTLEHSYAMKVEAATRRLQGLYDRVSRFFLNRIRQIDHDGEIAKAEWVGFCRVASNAIQKSGSALNHLQSNSEQSLFDRSKAFNDRLTELDGLAARALETTFASWAALNWRTLQAAILRQGKWYSRAQNRDINLHRDIALAYLDLLPFVWEDFFGTQLSGLVRETANNTLAELQKSGQTIAGAMAMLRHQPDNLRESMDTTLKTADQCFELQAGEVCSSLAVQIQRTRQDLSNGMVETTAVFMKAAYAQAAQEPAGKGVKIRILDALTAHARKHAPSLFSQMRKELIDGVAILQTSVKPQLFRIIGYGRGLLDQFQQNVATHNILTPAQRKLLETALSTLPPPSFAP